ncbi:MAG: M15 family metallopeptidase [Alphaproteobacteria bacterium]
MELTTVIKRYKTCPIKECGEQLVRIPKSIFPYIEPHDYTAKGAPYNGASPWDIREGVLKALLEAHEELTRRRPGWKIAIFDAYRPNEVQAYMVELEYAVQAKKVLHKEYKDLTEADREKLAPIVFRIWGVPSEDPKTPPPHSTGAALDITLMRPNGKLAWMGSPIDENSDRSNPNHFLKSKFWNLMGRRAHSNRQLLNDVMIAAGFVRHQTEWWHFSRGDQYWQWLQETELGRPAKPAIYGRAALLLNK